jgi:hypothetical protein
LLTTTIYEGFESSYSETLPDKEEFIIDFNKVDPDFVDTEPVSYELPALGECDYDERVRARGGGYGTVQEPHHAV